MPRRDLTALAAGRSSTGKSPYLTGAAYGSFGMIVVGASVAISRSLVGYPVAPSQALRYLLAAGILLIFARMRRLPVRRPTLREAGRLVLLAATGLVGFNACVIGALGRAEPPAVGVVVGATPIVLAVLAPLAAGSAPRVRVVVAALAVVGGVALVEGGGRTSVAGAMLAAGALAGEVLFTLLAAPLLPRLGPVGVSVHSCLLAGVMLAVATPIESAVTGSAVLPRPSPSQVAALGYLVVMVTAVAFLAWYTAVARLGADRAGLLVGLMPVGTLAASLALGSSTLTVGAASGVGLVAAGVAAGMTASARPRRCPTLEAQEIGRRRKLLSAA